MYYCSLVERGAQNGRHRYISIFTAHSTRSASASAAADSGITSSDILKAADWSTESVFRKFYYRPTHDPLYGRTVLPSRSSET